MTARLAMVAITILLLADVVTGQTQPAARSATIGLLSGTSRQWQQLPLETFRRELREAGWEEGRNLSIEERFVDGEVGRLPALSEELVQRNVEIIVAATSAATRAAMTATKTIPIVMVDVGDPLGMNFVPSLSRPGGNVTGVTNLALGLTQKRLAILKETLPRARRVAMISHPDNLIAAPQWRDAEAAARKLGLTLQRLQVRTGDDLRRAIREAANARADALVPLADPVNTVLTHDILELAARYRIPTMMEYRDQVEAGALLAYFSDPQETYGRAASYVARILNGARPGDLPVEQPTSFQLAVNLKTAKALGLTIPPAVLVQATAVIE